MIVRAESETAVHSIPFRCSVLCVEQGQIREIKQIERSRLAFQALLAQILGGASRILLLDRQARPYVPVKSIPLINAKTPATDTNIASKRFIHLGLIRSESL